MLLLILVSLVWAFSFGLMKRYAVGLDPAWVAVVRLLVAGLVFMPFARLGRLPSRLWARLLVIGGVQFGLMYVLYNASFAYLKGWEVAVLTVFTPLYVVLVHDVGQRRLSAWLWLLAIVGVAGALLAMDARLPSTGRVKGLLLVQASNLCFAWGQVRYRQTMMAWRGVSDASVFAVLFVGGLALATGVVVVTAAPLPRFGLGQAMVLLYLGAVASGLGFYLFNRGARQVSVGQLSIMNDLKIPLAAAVSLLVFGEGGSVASLLVGLGLVVGAATLATIGRRDVAAD